MSPRKAKRRHLAPRLEKKTGWYGEYSKRQRAGRLAFIVILASLFACIRVFPDFKSFGLSGILSLLSQSTYFGIRFSGVAETDIDGFISRQAEYSWAQVLANVNPPSTLPGCVVASMSTSNPDYWYEV
jgi:hypothetical protein